VGDAVQAREAEAAGADYVVLSPVFATGSKADAGPGHGIAELVKIRSAVRVPVLAIGGITRANAVEVIRAGADGIAVISAVVSAPDIRQAASALLQVVTDAKREAGR
jgi:thiamine-phosphate pyrophosphorylase